MTTCLVLGAVAAAMAASSVLAFGRWDSGERERPAAHRVAGMLFVDGLPAANASIALHPLGSHAGEVYRPVGASKPDGSFSLMTYAPDDGAPVGEYVVTVLYIDRTQPYDECGDPATHDVLGGRYLDAAQSPLRARVVPGSNEIKLIAQSPGRWSNMRLRDLAFKR